MGFNNSITFNTGKIFEHSSTQGHQASKLSGGLKLDCLNSACSNSALSRAVDFIGNFQMGTKPMKERAFKEGRVGAWEWGQPREVFEKFHNKLNGKF